MLNATAGFSLTDFKQLCSRAEDLGSEMDCWTLRLVCRALQAEHA